MCNEIVIVDEPLTIDCGNACRWSHVSSTYKLTLAWDKWYSMMISVFMLDGDLIS